MGVLRLYKKNGVPPHFLRVVYAFYALLWASWMGACGRQEIQPLTFRPAPWQDGEVSTFRATDLNDKYAGTAQFHISHNNADGWTMRREISAQNMQEVVVVDVTASELRPLQALLIRIDGDGQERVETTYSGGQANLMLTSKQDVTTYQRIDVPSDVRDQRILLMLVRMLPLARGYVTRLNSFLPIAGLLERVTVSVVKEERVSVPAGGYNAWLVELDTGESKTRAWIGVEPPRLLLKFVDGRTRGAFELTDYQPGG